MTNAPDDLLAHRKDVQTATGMTSGADVGIVGDGAHQRTGGYHEGMDVLVAIGRYHPPAYSHIGSTNEDYSARLARDRNGLTNDASAMDYGSDWSHGGRAAWLRFNNALAAALKSGDSRLPAVRAINYSPDGTTKRRIDRETNWVNSSTSDTVTVHTHVEFYRDTKGNRTMTLNQILSLIQVAISGGSMTDPNSDFTAKCTGPSTRQNSRDAILGDQGSYRDWGYGVEGEAGADGTNPPKPTSRFGVIFAAAKTILSWAKDGVPVNVTMTDADLDTLANKIVAKMPAPVYPKYGPIQE